MKSVGHLVGRARCIYFQHCMYTRGRHGTTELWAVPTLPWLNVVSAGQLLWISFQRGPGVADGGLEIVLFIYPL
jgi:hypothetical protein